MKIIVSHLTPDLDSCVSTWLLKKFVYPEEEIKYKFVKAIKNAISETNEIWVDTGGGEFDHHQKNDFECAASLVAKKYNLLTNSVIEKIVSYTLLVDHGKYFHLNLQTSNLMYIIHGLNARYPTTPEIVMDKVCDIIESWFSYLEQENEILEAVNEKYEFETSIGKCIAFDIDSQTLREWSYHKGYRLYIYKDRNTGYVGIKAKGDDDIDLTNVYQKLHNIESEKEWFLHSSKQLVLCGTKKVPTEHTSKLTLSNIVSVISSI